MIVDLHAHYFPKDYNAILLRIGGRSLPEAARPITARPMREDDPAGIATRLARMDEAEVQMQVLSPAASPPYAEKEADAVAASSIRAIQLAFEHEGLEFAHFLQNSGQLNYPPIGDLVREAAMHRVEAQQMGVGFDGRQVVDADHLDIRAARLDDGAQHIAADAAESIDADTN